VAATVGRKCGMTAIVTAADTAAPTRKSPSGRHRNPGRPTAKLPLLASSRPCRRRLRPSAFRPFAPLVVGTKRQILSRIRMHMGFCQDKKLAAFILAYIVMDYVISDNVNWACAKTNIQERDFESNFCWRAAILLTIAQTHHKNEALISGRLSDRVSCLPS